MAFELWEMLKESISAYANLSVVTFFTLVSLGLALSYIVWVLFSVKVKAAEDDYWGSLWAEGADLGYHGGTEFDRGYHVGNSRAGGANFQFVFQNHPSGGEGLPSNLVDFFMGQGLEKLIQELAENDPDRYGTPPASRTAVEGLPDVVVDDKLLGSDSAQCAVCQDDFEKDMVVKQMPSKHVYHSECLLPWLELHNSCPVCRYELPSDDPDYENRARGIAASGGENDASGNVRFGSPGSQTDTGDDEEGGQFRSFVERTFSIMFRPRNSGTDNSGGDSGSSCPQNMGTN
nr:PREDICTED: E3 ubiquitin-protein ligase RING1-like [Daucus carota subsp. sativus]